MSCQRRLLSESINIYRLIKSWQGRRSSGLDACRLPINEIKPLSNPIDWCITIYVYIYFWSNKVLVYHYNHLPPLVEPRMVGLYLYSIRWLSDSPHNPDIPVSACTSPIRKSLCVHTQFFSCFFILAICLNSTVFFNFHSFPLHFYELVLKVKQQQYKYKYSHTHNTINNAKYVYH